MRIDQIVIGAAKGDAITGMALGLRTELRKFGESDLYAEFISPDILDQDVREIDSQPPGLAVNATVYHLSYGHPRVTAYLQQRRERLVVAYHNITPSHWYLAHNPEFAAGLEWGRYELRLLRDRAVLAIADSDFNAEELTNEGYRNVHVVPAGFDPFRLKAEQFDLRLANQLRQRYPKGYVLAVGQVLPHKQVELLIETVHLANSFHRLGLGLVVAGIVRQQHYFDALERFRLSQPLVDVWMTGAVSNSQLATLYREARCFLSMSGHEGLCIPPVEAMAMGLPVIARSAGAVAATVGDGGVIVGHNAGPAAAAEAISMVVEDPAISITLRTQGFNRAAYFAQQDSAAQAVKLIMDVFS
jgi:glycosyltransferase involved in cell wall biosynthesis